MAFRKSPRVPTYKTALRPWKVLTACCIAPSFNLLVALPDFRLEISVGGMYSI